MKGYHDVARHPQAGCIPGLAMPRWDAPFFYANTEIFRERMLRAVREAPKEPRGSSPQHFFPAIGQAVNRYLESHPVGWHDWEDQA